MTIHVHYEFEDDLMPDRQMAVLDGEDDTFTVAHHEVLGETYMDAYQLRVQGNGRIIRILTEDYSQDGMPEVMKEALQAIESEEIITRLLPGNQYRHPIGMLINRQIVRLTLVATFKCASNH